LGAYYVIESNYHHAIRVAVLALGLVIAGALMAYALSAKAASSQTNGIGAPCEWTIVDSPRVAFDALYSIEAISSTDIWAGGSTETIGGGGPKPLIERWDGAAWVVGPAPSEFTSVFALSAVAADDIWAVSQYGPGGRIQPTIARWDGNAWARVPSPNPGLYYNTFSYDIDMNSSSDGWVVGASADTTGSPAKEIILHWDGAAWSAVPTPVHSADSLLVGVAAISTDDVWAVGGTRSGSTSAPLIEHWDGTSWTVVPSPIVPGNSVLSDVSAVSPNDVWAAGVYTAPDGSSQTLLEHWDGVAWSVIPSPVTASRYNVLRKIAAAASSDVWAVGWSSPNDSSLPRHTLTMHWDGTVWTVVPSPNGAEHSQLEGVIAGPAGVWAVGHAWDSRTNEAHGIIERCVAPATPTPSPSPSPSPSASPSPACPSDDDDDDRRHNRGGGARSCPCILDDKDFDDDGLRNRVDIDDDNDGVKDWKDPDDDNDGLLDRRDPDDDNDGIPDRHDRDDGRLWCRNRDD
jgi:hypothetical protein